jgi:hypothetical protein
MSQVTLQGNASGTGIFTIAAPNSNTNRTLNLPDAAGAVIVGTQPAGDIVGTTATQTLTNKSISGAQINSGTVAVARLGSGTPGTGNFLRGDGSWQTVPASAPSTTDVLNATAGASVGAVGTYAFLGFHSNANVDVGTTYAGSGFSYAGVLRTGNNWTNTADNLGGIGSAQHQNVSPSGTWRCMGTSRGNVSGSGGAFPATLFLRVS